MSSNTPFIDSTEDNNQKKTMTKNRVPPEDKSGSASIEAEKQRKKIKRYLNLHGINQGLLRKLKQNGQRNKILKKDPYNYPVQMIANCENKNQKT